MNSTQLPDFTPQLNDRRRAEFLASSLAVLRPPTGEDDSALDASPLRLTRPEPPRDLDLPLLPPKRYPRISSTQTESAIKALQPPPPLDGFIGRRAELDKAVLALLGDQPVVITGQSGAGKTTLLRQIAHDSRIRGRFRRVWWMDDLQNASTTLALALEAPTVLLADLNEQPKRLRSFLAEARVLLLVDSVTGSGTLDGLEWVLAMTPYVAVAEDRPSAGVKTGIPLNGLPRSVAAQWLESLCGEPEEVCLALIELVDGMPGALRLIAALIAEDNVPAQAIMDVLQHAGHTSRERIAALYTASFDSMPNDYQNLALALAQAPSRWVTAEKVLERFGKALAGQRALAFFEKRFFIERRGNLIRVLGDWPEHILRNASRSDSINPLPKAVDPFQAFGDIERNASEAVALHERGVKLMDEAGKDADEEVARILEDALNKRLRNGTKYEVAETLVALGRLAYLRGDEGEAIRRLESAAEHLHELHDEPALEIVRVALSRCYRRAGRLDAALSVLGDDAPPQDLAMVYRARGDWEPALAVYERWIASNPDEAGLQTALLGRAETLILAGRPRDALASVENGKGTQKKSGASAFVSGWIKALAYHTQGNLDRALAAYSEAQAESPPNHRGILARAMAKAMAASGEVRAAAMLVGAEGLWYEARLPRPIFARQRLSHALLAHLNLMLGDQRGAEQSARLAHSLTGEPSDSEAEAILCRVLGRLARQSGEYAAAVHAFDSEVAARNAMAYRDDHEIGVALHCLADAQCANRERDRAIANYRRALTHKDPARSRDSVIRTYLALSEMLIEAGRGVEALELSQMLISLISQPKAFDLQLNGYALSLHAQAQFNAGRGPRGESLYQDWVGMLRQRRAEAIQHRHPGMPILVIGLYLRSQPQLEGDSIGLIDFAEQALQLAEEQFPGTVVSAGARRDLGELYLRLDRLHDSIEVLTPLVEAKNLPDTPPITNMLLDTHLAMARAYARLPEIAIDKMLAHIESAAQSEPVAEKKAAILREAAEIAQRAGAESTAVDLLARAIALLPREQNLSEYIDVLVALAYARLRIRQFGEAIDTFEEAIQIVESNPRQDQGLLASVLFDMGTAHAALGQYRRAADTFRRSLGYQDRTQAMRYLETSIALARSESEAGNDQRAVQAYQEALRLDILTPALRRTLLVEQAEAYTRINQLTQAVNSYDAAIATEIGPDADSAAGKAQRASIQRGLGLVYTRLGNHDAARSHFEALLAEVQDELTGETILALADGYRAQGKQVEALDTYHRALNFLNKPGDAPMRAIAARSLGDLYLERNQLSNAILHLEAALEIERAQPQQRGGRIVSILRSLARAHELRSDLDKAIIRHHEALVYQDTRHAPEESVETLRELGRLYTEQKKYGEAARALEEALRIVERQPTPDANKRHQITVALATVRRGQGQLETAAAMLEQVSKVTSDRGIRSTAEIALKDARAEIERHLKTLEAADQSLALLNRVSPPDLMGVIFVRALQARTMYLLGRSDEASRLIDLLLDTLVERQSEANGPELMRVVSRHLIQGRIAEKASDPGSAQKAFAEAVAVLEKDARSNVNLTWATRFRLVGLGTTTQN